jgi:hypothetical protein
MGSGSYSTTVPPSLMMVLILVMESLKEVLMAPNTNPFSVPVLDDRGTYVLWTVLVAGSFSVLSLIAGRDYHYQCRHGRTYLMYLKWNYSVRLNKPVVGFRPISECLPRGRKYEPEVSVPAAAALY